MKYLIFSKDVTNLQLRKLLKVSKLQMKGYVWKELKCYHIFDRVVPINMLGSLNQIISVCALLSSFHELKHNISDYTHQLQLFTLHKKLFFSLLFKIVNQSSLIFNSFHSIITSRKYEQVFVKLKSSKNMYIH